jgi:SAM-dependent methyltransferase
MNTVVAEYLDERKETFLNENEEEFHTVMKLVRQYKTITPDTQLLELGTGTGWFQIRCQQEGIACRGLEIDPDLAACAIELGQRHGINPQIQVGSIETTDIGVAKYDIIVASFVFEHVEDWRLGLAKVAAALKPGGLFFFGSTNKFSFRQGEYWIPLYGWLPDSCRYAVRRALQGDAIMEWGIDFNQFTYPLLRRHFTQLGFSRVLDRADVLDPDNLNNPTMAKQAVLRLLKRSPWLKHSLLWFSFNTMFICIK